ncbi:MAG TPA: DUF1990 family protein [Vulgatibacter sp.]|nr:DUF1990 family protein [Vulgatibacter sp.]
MARWRHLRGWSDAELAACLDAAEELPLNFRDDLPLVPERGWNRVRSRAVIAREAPGPPSTAGAFSRAWRAVEAFEHSDPRIVVAHFRPSVPLERRHLLLELRPLSLRFLCPARVAAVRAESDAASTRRGFTIETLAGHVERGREEFLLEKDHRTGEVRFGIEAAWREGDFPSLWSRIGFELLGRRYQRAWHRLAHLRLRQIAAGLEAHDPLAGVGLAHEGRQMPFEQVQFFAQRGLGRRGVEVEQEVEDMRRDTLWNAAGLGALSGVRSLGPPALLGGRLGRRAGSLLSALGAGEMVADKLPIPPRTRPASLVARAISGAFAGGMAARRRRSRGRASLVGASAAVAATFLSGRLRAMAVRRSRLLGHVVAIAEDALVIGAGRRLAARTRRGRRARPPG